MFGNSSLPAVQSPNELQQNTETLETSARTLASTIAPYLQVTDESVKEYLDADSSRSLQNMKFFRLKSCTTEHEEDMGLYMYQKMEKLFVAVHPLQETIAYGITSYQGKTDLILGVQSSKAEGIVKPLLEGLLTGVELVKPDVGFERGISSFKYGGAISGIPVCRLNDEVQKFDISTLMRSLNGQNYTLLCVAKPLPLQDTQTKYGEIVKVRDDCFAVSKKNLAFQKSESDTDTKTKGSSHTSNVGGYVGGLLGPVMLGLNLGYSYSRSVSTALAKTTGTSETESHDVQNGFALEMMEYCDKAIERLRQAQNTGLWGTALLYSSDRQLTTQIMQACLNAELAKGEKNILPPRQFRFTLDANNGVAFPALYNNNPLLAPITSSELGFLCTPPFESVPDFELKQGKMFPMIAPTTDGVVIGNVSDGHRPLEHMTFSLSEEDLNKHTFIGGITGSGKTTTVKRILANCDKRFMVIESAKKEYRNINLPKGKTPVVYTLGKPEIHCLQFNPFYVQCGVNLQTHIDFLKDLFNASFSFYGPMPYILEKCLQNVYRNKGWNLTLGYHPFMINKDNIAAVFDYGFMSGKYAHAAHKYLFPTMQDLKDEVARYIETELNYDGEVSGNIKTAILTRLESLCVGSKGFMFNTSKVIDMDAMMNQNVVFELESLSDDADKAFCVGLLIIFIKEYRQVQKEKVDNTHGLKHLLVIEEAHRLLKNIETDRSSETMGNPKGKAVEHFTNMIAEMRSYGQGVIIAEQIPSKLAPDVIKNSSNKIIQRLVSSDDQNIVSNTIGLSKEDAIVVGTLRTGQALCHKEGMQLPVLVQVNEIKDINVSDDEAFINQEGQMFYDINCSVLKESIVDVIDSCSLKVLNSLLAQDAQTVAHTISYSKGQMKRAFEVKGASFIIQRDEGKMFGEALLEGVSNLLTNGVYKLNSLMGDELHTTLGALFETELPDNMDDICKLLKSGYMQEPRNRCITVISQLLIGQFTNELNLRKCIAEYFAVQNEVLISEIEEAVLKGVK